MCIFHKWGKWQQYDKSVHAIRLSENWMLRAATEHWQMKRCNRCGKVKHEYIGLTAH